MEHRWGQRVALKIPVRLIAESCDPIIRQTQNISISGAFLPRPLISEAEFTSPKSDRPAFFGPGLMTVYAAL